MRARKLMLVYGTSFLLLLAGAWFSLKIGAFSFKTEELVRFLQEGGSTNEALVLYDVRLPRLITAVLVGANMAVAGALVQSLTQNPLASPSVLGINAGASFFVVAGILFMPSLTGLSLVGAGFLGGALAAGVIFLMSAILQGGRMLVKIALVGVVIQSLFASGTQSLMLFNEESIHQILVWLTGTVAGSTWEDVRILLPLTLLGLITAVIMSKALSVMSLGEDVARGLGQQVRLQKTAVTLLVVVLAGASVAFTGPIGFVGLIVPHIVRYLVGPRHALVLPASALIGAALLVLADVGSRFISFPSETPVGIVTALIGAPYFIYLARKTQR